MNKKALEFLKELMNQPSPSGFETPAQHVVKARMKMFADKVTTDVHGNVTGILNAEANQKIMLAGHMDEIGVMITHVDSDGFIYFAAIGGLDPLITIGQRVCIINEKGTVKGVVGRKPIHLLTFDDSKKKIKTEDLWIDIGANSKKDALKAVAVGDPVVIQQDFIEMRNNLASSRAFDDRIGVWVISEVLRWLKGKTLNVAVYAVATVQEEIGTRGAITSSYNINPQVGIAVDVGFTSDFPGGNPKKTGDVSLGKGPILHVGGNINPVLGKMLCSTAKKKKIPYQMQAEPHVTGTDARSIQVARGGCATALVSIPNRYMHSPVEVISLKDAERTVALIAETILAMSGIEDFIPK